MAVHSLQVFPARLRIARTTAGLKQETIAAAIGVNPSLLCALEKGRRWMTNEELVPRLVQALNSRPNEAEALRQAAMHDKAIHTLQRLGFPLELLVLVSQTLRLTEVLSPAEIEHLTGYMGKLRSNKTSLAPMLAPDPAAGEHAM